MKLVRICNEKPGGVGSQLTRCSERIKKDLTMNRQLYLLLIPFVLWYILFAYIPCGDWWGHLRITTMFGWVFPKVNGLEWKNLLFFSQPNVPKVVEKHIDDQS